MKIFAFGTFLFCLASIGVVEAQSAPTPAPTTAPSSTPAPAVAYAVAAGAYGLASQGSPGRTDLSELLFSITRGAGTFRYGATVGAYAFPVVGQPLASTFQAGANTNLFGPVPIAYVAYAPNGRLTLSAGKLPTLLGQENGFTYQNVNLERGLGWNAEPIIARGVRAVFSSGRISADLGLNDGFYSGTWPAIEGLFGYAPSPATSLAFAFVVPNPNTPGNVTSSVANKAEYNVMLTQTFSKLQLTPYVLFVRSPASSQAGYASTESAFAQVLIANYVANPAFSAAFRFEHFANSSLGSDTGANADLVGYGAGSAATTWTFTPAYHYKQLLLRAEYAAVRAVGPAPFAQNRIGLQILGQW